jgi:hypothetical protein
MSMAVLRMQLIPGHTLECCITTFAHVTAAAQQTAEFMGSDPFMALLGLRMALIAYPVVALSRVRGLIKVPSSMPYVQQMLGSSRCR